MLSFYHQFIYLTYSSIFFLLSSTFWYFLFYCFVCVQMGVGVCLLKSLFSFHSTTISLSFSFNHAIFFVSHIYYRICTRCMCGWKSRWTQNKWDMEWSDGRERRAKADFFLPENSIPNRQIHINFAQCQFGIQAYRREASQVTKRNMWIGEYVSMFEVWVWVQCGSIREWSKSRLSSVCCAMYIFRFVYVCVCAQHVTIAKWHKIHL